MKMIQLAGTDLEESLERVERVRERARAGLLNQCLPVIPLIGTPGAAHLAGIPGL